MTNLKRWMLVILLFLSGFLFSQEVEVRYYTYEELPDASLYLPAPPDFGSPFFADDFQQWIWGKSMRNTERGAMASEDSKIDMERMAEIYGEVMGITISETETPAIWNFMLRSGKTGHASVWLAKQYYMRVRPFALMNEPVFGKYDDGEALRHNGSYPSGHTAWGWSTAMALAEMVPELQDDILKRGFQYGESRVIVGAHWQTDVDAARLAVSAAMARMHCHPEYQADLDAARAEFLKITGMKPRITDYPDGQKILDPPVDTNSRRYYSDFIQYYQAKNERHGSRGMQAIIDADNSDIALMNCFSTALGISLSPCETPHIAALLSMAKQIFLNETSRLKAKSFRKRPYIQMSEPSLIPEDEEANALTSSYPSSSSAMGWGLALVLVEVAPEYQDYILSRGYEFGRSRVIAGYHYATDVQAGRLLASMVFIRMQNDPTFRQLLKAAREEYNSITSR